MTNGPRNRIVVFRLSQDEYQLLKAASQQAGARSLSDFTRGEVLDYLESHAASGGVDRRFASLEEQIAVLRLQLNVLLEGASHAEFKRS